jgi:hypothetical protein
MRKPDADPPPPRVCVALPQNGKCQIFHSHYVAVCRSKVLVVCVCEFWFFLFQKTKFIFYRNIEKTRRNSIQLPKFKKKKNERNSVSPNFLVPATKRKTAIGAGSHLAACGATMSWGGTGREVRGHWQRPPCHADRRWSTPPGAERRSAAGHRLHSVNLSTNIQMSPNMQMSVKCSNVFWMCTAHEQYLNV